MKQTYAVSGMTCGGCVASVTEKLSKVSGIESVKVHLDRGEIEVDMRHQVSLSNLKAALPEKYDIREKGDRVTPLDIPEEKGKFSQLQPLFLIFAYLFGAAFLLNYQNWNTQEAMLDFMGLFYVVFSFFKFLDLAGFPESFRMYDPLAKAIPAYGWVYPFLELALGLLFLMRFQIQTALVITVIILGITTVGVTKTLWDKKSIRCACLGTALKLPMTEATFIENAIMLIMAGIMLM
ncbi:MAG: MauE/DoxX family redox-associated membrane protein [Bacteroidota bacterium]